MQKTVLKFGLLGGITLVVLFLLEYFLFKDVSFSDKEIFGNLSIFIATLFIFFGIRSYRNNYNNGYISFGRAMGVGTLIMLIPAVFFGVYNAVYVEYIYPGFYDDYAAFMRADLAKHYSGAELAQQIAEMETMMKTFTENLFLSCFFMFITVALIGFVVTLISAVILRKKKPVRDGIID